MQDFIEYAIKIYHIAVVDVFKTYTQTANNDNNDPKTNISNPMEMTFAFPPVR